MENEAALKELKTVLDYIDSIPAGYERHLEVVSLLYGFILILKIGTFSNLCLHVNKTKRNTH